MAYTMMCPHDWIDASNTKRRDFVRSVLLS